MAQNKISDFTKLQKLLQDYGVGFAAYESGNPKYPDRAPGKCIVLEANKMEKVRGYNDFVTEIYFNAAGEFIDIGVWE